MARKRNKRVEEAPQEDIFAALARHGTHMFQQEAPPAPVQRQATPEAPDSKALLEQIGRLQSQVEDMARRQYMQPAPQRQPQQAQGIRRQDVTLNLDGLPDPALDTAAYNRE